MHSFFVSMLAAASVVAAATTSAPSDTMPDLSKIPQCALQCIAEAAGSTSCELTDPYCQCTTGAADFVKVGVPCLCQSECTSEELMGALAASSDICSAALKAHGEEFRAPEASLDICKAFAGGAAAPPSDQTSPESSAPSPTPSGYAPQTNSTASAPSRNGANASNTSSNGTSGAQESTGGAAVVGVGLRMIGTAVLIGLVGAGVAAL